MRISEIIFYQNDLRFTNTSFEKAGIQDFLIDSRIIFKTDRVIFVCPEGRIKVLKDKYNEFKPTADANA